MPAVVCVFLCVQALLHTDTYTLPVSSCLVDCDRKYSPTCSSSLSKMQSCRCRAEYLAGYLPLLSFSPLPSFHFLLFVPPLHFVTAPSVSLPIPFGLPFVTTPPPPLCSAYSPNFFPFWFSPPLVSSLLLFLSLSILTPQSYSVFSPSTFLPLFCFLAVLSSTLHCFLSFPPLLSFSYSIILSSYLLIFSPPPFPFWSFLFPLW